MLRKSYFCIILRGVVLLVCTSVLNYLGVDTELALTLSVNHFTCLLN